MKISQAIERESILRLKQRLRLQAFAGRCPGSLQFHFWSSLESGADRRLTDRLAAAELRFVDACIEDVDFASRRGLDRRNTLQLAQGAWLKAHENFIITGLTEPAS